jgi:hypothetical protein
VLILCSLLESSVILSDSSLSGLLLGKWHIADMNQHNAEPDAAISAADSMNDFIVAPGYPLKMVIIVSTFSAVPIGV